MNSIDLSLGLRLGLRRQALPSFDRFVSPGATGGGDGSYGNPWLPSEFTAASSGLTTGSRIGIKGGTDTGGLINPQLLKASGATGFYFGAYGGGNKPILRCDAPITGGWVDQGSNVWRVAVTYVSASTSHSGNVFRDGLPMILVQATVNLVASGQACNLDWGWNGSTPNAVTSGFIYIYSTVDPATDGHTYSYSKYANGIEVGGDDVVIEDIELRGALHKGGNFHVDGRRVAIRRLVSRHGSSHSGYVGPDPMAEDCLFFGGRNRQATSGSGDHLVSNTTAFGGRDTALLRRCTFDGALDEYAAAGMALDPSADNVGGFQSHDSGSGTLASVTFENCTFRDGSLGFNSGAAIVTMTSPICASAKALIGEQNRAATYHITGATGTVGMILSTNASTGPQTLNTTDCDLDIDGSLHGVATKAAVRSANSGLTFNHNRLRDHITMTGASGTRCLDNVRKGTIKTNNCQFDGTLTHHDLLAQFVAGTDAVVDPASDNNTYKTGIGWVIDNVTYASLAALKAAVAPAEANSVAV